MRISYLLGATALVGSIFSAAPAFAQAVPNVTPVAPPQATSPALNNDNVTEQAVTVSADGQQDDDGNIVVTGSRIARPETDGVLPGVQITAQSIETRGFTNALEALNDIPLVGPGASPLNGNNGGQTASLGAAFVDLLDLGTARTLTLVNGRRFVSGNAASLFVAGNETGSQVDINVIPTSLIERVDTVTVGGAAAYGADAIAGVVNFVLKDDFDGTQVRALTGISDRGDAAQFQLSATAGRNFLDDRANVTASFEYSRNDGLQATDRDFRIIRPGTYTNPFNGGLRNAGFAPNAIIDVTNLNNGAFLRPADDGQPSTLFGLGLVTQTLSYAGTVLNAQGVSATAANNGFYVPYTPIRGNNAAGQAVTTNYITFQNGVAPVGFLLGGRTAGGSASTLSSSINNGFFSYSASQIIAGTPGGNTAITANGLNGRTTQAANVPFTTFAPTSLPGNVTAAQVFASYGVTAPAGATTAQQTALAVNILQANRFTAREFLAANPNTNLNYFIGTFSPNVPRIANTDTSLVSVRVNGANVQVPVNQVLPFVSVPLEFNDDGTLRAYTFSGPVGGNDPLTTGSARGGDGGFRRSLENTVLRTQQDRYIANLLGKLDISDQVTLFTENTYANVFNRSLGNVVSQNFVSQTQENAPLLVNYNNPYLTAQNRAVLTSVGISPTATNQGNFLITRQNQDLAGSNPFTNHQETYRIVGGLRSRFNMIGQRWNAEISGSYGRSTQTTRSTNLLDVEYQLALDAVDRGQLLTGTPSGEIVCRSQVLPGQYLGRTPVGTATNITRVRGADGVLQEVLVTPTITQAMIDSCRPLNPFGFNNMSDASKQYVLGRTTFRNVSQQIYAQASLGGGLFNLPAGTLSFNVNGEYRRDELDYSTDTLNQLGRTRSAPSSNTSAFTETYEIGGELAVPITGPDFLGFLGRLEFRPAVRVSQQGGSGQTFRNLAGLVSTPTRNSPAYTIYSLAGTWAPIRDIQFRGNYTRSIRQPSIVELFLGGQPSFTTPTDLCGRNNFQAGSTSTGARERRQANCVAAAIANGNAANASEALTFLQNFTPTGAGLQGVFNGNTSVNPERGKSWTAGAALTPRWLPGLSISGDYIHVRVNDQIVTASIQNFLQTCYDSALYPNPTGEVGVNSCTQFTRGSDFQLQNGYAASFLNLGALEVNAVNASANYSFSLGSDRVVLRGNAYRLINYKTSAIGNFTDTIESAGSFGRAKWETQLSARYEHDAYYGQVTWNRTDPTRIFVSGEPATAELYPYTRYPTQNNIDLTFGADVNDKFRLQFVANNVLDNTTAGDLGYRFADYYDQIGRRYRVTVTTRF